MGNLCCRRVGYSPNGTEVDNGRCHPQQPQEPQQQKTMSNAYHNAGDDCAINELLEGRMDLDVVLPDGRKVRLTVERRTPMMDLLVQAASATKISPAGHIIHVFGDGGKGSSTLHYKPSTPIGSLDANTICIVPKKDLQDLTARRAPKMANRPFEPTFRVQVHLPRNQLTVARVSPRVKISELRNMVCQEKGLDTNKYQLVRPSVPGQPLSGDLTLAEYGSTEITLLSNSCIESHICNSTSHIMPYSKRIEEQKKKTGILRLLAEDANQKTQRKTMTSDNRTAPTVKASEAPHQGRYKPKKRRPAPPPPPPTLPEPPFHSRQSSSDSSGYHEATSSYLHEEHCTAEKASSDSSGVSSLDAKVPQPNVMNTKKRKAPLPPAPPHADEKHKSQKEADKTVDIPREKPPGEPESQPRQPATVITAHLPPKDVPTEISKEVRKSAPQVPETLQRVQKDAQNVEPCKVKESPSRNKNEGEAVTRVALVALNARIEQDVTQQEITSSIQAAFHSLDTPQKVGPSLLSIKQRERPPQNDPPSAEDDLQRPPTPPPITEERLIPDDTSIHVYPLQKSSARLNFEARDDLVDNLESFPPPPSEFRGIDNDPIDDEAPPVPCPSPFRSSPSKSLRRSSSLLSLTDSAPLRASNSSSKSKKVKHLQRSLSDLTVDDKGEFEAEQERLQREYLKLQRQFILWQQQLLNNHAMLREECIVPQYARTLRQSHSLPEGEDYTDETPTSCPLVSRSLSYEPTKSRCSTLPRSTINIPSLEFGSIPINNGTSTLRSSKTKSYFKPPQVRISTKNRQRLPPEIRKEGDLDIYDDTKILSTILPSFESLKLISESNDDDPDVVPFVLRNGLSTPKTDKFSKPQEEVKKVPPPVPNKVATLPKPDTRHNERNTNSVVYNGNTKCVNGDIGLLRDTGKVVEQSNNPPPPPPPPLPVAEKSKSSNPVKLNKVSGLQNNAGKKVIAPQVDPREQLMQEIRRFGGRTALRKISLDIPSS